MLLLTFVSRDFTDFILFVFQMLRSCLIIVTICIQGEDPKHKIFFVEIVTALVILHLYTLCRQTRSIFWKAD